jgi:phenylpropionate dioxygenase-like ring-hydroxylating dioxygenase large terminal subunit
MQVSPVAESTRLMPGGDNADRFDPTAAWYPVAYLPDLDRTKPTPFTLLGVDIVLWWNASGGQWQAVVDQCSHRLVPLSEGRIAADGCLECPYHGWTFDGTGACKHIPQQEPGAQAESSRRATIRAFPTQEQQGMLFVYAGNPEQAAATPVPVIGPLADAPDANWTLFNTFRDLPYEAATLLENVLDASHLPYTHHNTVGNRSNAAPVDMSIVESNKQGFTGLWTEGPRKGKLGTQHTRFIAPNLMWHDLTSKQFGRTITAVYATPTRKGECRLFARFPFQFSSKIPAFFISITPQWYSHIGQNKILEDDQIFLHAQERVLEGQSDQFAQAFYLPTKADRYVFEFRQWLSQYQSDPFPGQALPPRINRRDILLDRYHSHTQHCASCRDALRRIQKIRLGLLILAGLGLAATPWLPAIVVSLSIVGLGGSWLLLGRLERQFYDGQKIPPRNFPEKRQAESRS